jgi:hypothetical protein
MPKRDDFYSKSNPHGPFQPIHRPVSGPPAEYIEGLSNSKNIRDWSARASANSGPKIAPGDGRKDESGKQRKPAANKP